MFVCLCVGYMYVVMSSIGCVENCSVVEWYCGCCDVEWVLCSSPVSCVWLLFRGKFSCITIDVRLGQNAF